MSSPSDSIAPSIESSVYQRYAAASNTVEAALCCPVSYAGNYLSNIPQEIIDKDYGCGDPSPYVNAGETVLDLGSGGGKLCYILAQVVGERGKIIGVDCNPEMLALARKYQSEMVERLGYANVDFRYGMIQDLKLNLDLLGKRLDDAPIRSPQDWVQSRFAEEELREQSPLVQSGSVDCVVSNCVLNLVRQQDRRQLFDEVFRVLKPGGRAAISDIVADEDVPLHMQRDGHLWSGCLSGAFREDRFLQAFRDAGFHGVHIAKRQSEPWQTIEGIEFRSVTVLAYKAAGGEEFDLNQAAMYKGPFSDIRDDFGHIFKRGEWTAVGDKTFQLLSRPPYADCFELMSPVEPVSQLLAKPFADATRPRTPREVKGETYRVSFESGSSCCGDDGSCC
ncbi:MAG: methyltransferase domain-containing protein [Planctomycetaceae bacterium]|nr:methyltransferase domain-containing protein [Planctomycetaceae bacterium]MCA9045974.1 methyltransferase domain-containing protein [Planctomycetaceae bacterium]MCB9951233.1 methyltransferase domain-containing protein [Planctomycetaceae bacterium]